MRTTAALIGCMLAAAGAAGAAGAEPIAQVAARQAQPIIAHRALIAEIEGMYAVDQMLRRQFLALRKDASDQERTELDALWRTQYAPVDVAQTERLKALLVGRGWFRMSEVGEKTADDALTLANHSPDFAFQEQVVAMLDQLPANERPSGYANIWDRVALQDGRLQRYGTQDFRCVDGHHAPSDRIEDPAHLEARRAEVGIEPMADNLAAMDKIYGRCSAVDPRPKAR